MYNITEDCEEDDSKALNIPVVRRSIFKTNFHLLHEIHKQGKSSWNINWIECECSHCKGSSKLHYGLNIPTVKKANSWWVIKYWKARYIRFNVPFL